MDKKYVASFKSKRKMLLRNIVLSKYIYLMILPVIAFYIVFHYVPMYGVIIAFKHYRISDGILGSEWVGFKYFIQFFKSFMFLRLIKNTFMLNLYQLIFAFPAPILFALLINELTNQKFKRIVQTISYLPHFISTVVIVGFVVLLFQVKGPINGLLKLFDTGPVHFMSDPRCFRFLYVGSDIWAGIGWGSIVYLAAISAVDPCLYEAMTMDGGGRLAKALYITLPSIKPTIVILLIFKLGGMLKIGFEKVFLMYSPTTYEVADVIATYTYRVGLQGANFSYGAAIGLFNSLVGFVLIVITNYVSRKVTETSLW